MKRTHPTALPLDAIRMEQQAGKPTQKTKPGEGYTRRIQGKKKLTSALLQEQLQATQAKLRELQEQNDLLRMKESLQTGLLEGLELALHTVGATDAGGGPERSAESLLQAVLLDLQALGLKQSLQAVAVSEQQQQTAAPSAAGTAGPSTEAQVIIANTFASPAARLAAARAAFAAMSSDSGTSSSDSGSEMPVDNDPSKRMQHVMFSLTPEELQATQDLTLLELAERLKQDVARIVLARKADGGSDPAEVEKAILLFMRTMCLSLVSNDERHCVVVGMNLDTMQHEGMPDSMFEKVVLATKLQPQQLQHLTRAFKTYSDVMADLLKQQQGIFTQLQLLLGEASQSGSGQATSPPSSPSRSQHSAATASASDTAAAAAAGAAHYMSLATCVAVKRAEGPAQPTQQAAISTDASVPAAAAAAAAEETSGARTRSALLKAKTAAAAGAAAAGCGGGSSAGEALPPSQAVALQQQAVGGQQGQGLDSQSNLPAAAAVPSSSAGAAPSGSGAGTSSSAGGSSSSWLAPEGVLCLEDADKAEQLLLEWQRVAHRMKRQARSLASLVMNLLSPEQLADSMSAGYPYIVPPPRFCAHAIRMAQEQQKGAPQR